jgi:hypothetical protein
MKSMSLVIASQSSPTYFTQMPSMVLRLLTLLALVLMPFGMGAANAAPAHHVAAAEVAQHCDDKRGQPAEQSRDEAMDCAVSCSMIAVAQAQVKEPPVAHPILTAPRLAERGAGLHPETATPPPKLA